MHATLPRLEPTDFPRLDRRRLDTLQVNLGYLCNLSCTHCHVAAGPNRTEAMDRETVDLVLEFLRRHRARGVRTLDLTGGAPEMNPHFRHLVHEARSLGVEVIDRCDLTILLEPGFEDLVGFLAAERVRVVASMPCYLEENVDRQRGKGTYAGSLEALRRLNAAGYGRPGSALVLDLVYNPAGPVLPPEQRALEADYKRELGRLGIAFDALLTLANMPIQRFGSTLISKGTFDGYVAMLRAAHRADNLAGVMCRTLVSVDWQGWVYDCDFNQMLGLPLGASARRTHLRDLLERDLAGAPIAVRNHCYGCTAGQGSSCGGALTAGTPVAAAA
jgi:radical SAM/Cys-rich protein